MISVIKSPSTNQKFLLLDAPTNKTLPNYIDVFKRENVSDLIRICHRPSHGQENTEYDAEELEKETGIRVNDDIKFEDGGVPDTDAIHQWLSIIEIAKERDTTIGVHCIAGIGRAPVLVAIALIEDGMDNLDAVSYIRKYRRGALNKNQVRFIDKYKKKKTARRGFLASLFS
ncbi:protein-tyrosine phosphatase-like protein [Pilobolus umbonatus]|nr:protein-tyrosine phosphatase-like protein [Pilobolus umbonatus]